MAGQPTIAPGAEVCIEAPQDALHLFDAQSGVRLN